METLILEIELTTVQYGHKVDGISKRLNRLK